MIPQRSTDAEAGFSLPEVTLALGLLAGVLISIGGLFVLSERLIHRGRHLTSAVTIAENIIEEANSWNYDDLYETFGLDGSASSYTVDTRVNAFAGQWQTELDGLLPSGWAEITLESIAPGGSPPALEDSACIRLAVRVVWNDALKTREVRLATVRM